MFDISYHSSSLKGTWIIHWNNSRNLRMNLGTGNTMRMSICSLWDIFRLSPNVTRPLSLLPILSSRLNPVLICLFSSSCIPIALAYLPTLSQFFCGSFKICLLLQLILCCCFSPRNGLSIWVNFNPQLSISLASELLESEWSSSEYTLGKLSFTSHLLSQWRLSFCPRRSVAFSRSITICLKYKISK